MALSGERRVLGLELAAGNDEESAWPRFVRSLCERGLHGVRLVISDDRRRYFRPETLALIDAEPEPAEEVPALLMAS